MNIESVRDEILVFLRPHYPEMRVRVEPLGEDPSKIAIYFLDPKFAVLYPLQRYHYLSHLIPREYQDRELKGSIWFELAPGETEGDLHFPDDELIRQIKGDVLRVFRARNVVEALDDLLCPIVSDGPHVDCYGDFRHTKSILAERGFADSDFFDVFHVLMAEGGYCDCEILFNVAKESRLAKRYWHARAEGRKPPTKHIIG